MKNMVFEESRGARSAQYPTKCKTWEFTWSTALPQTARGIERSLGVRFQGYLLMILALITTKPVNTVKLGLGTILCVCVYVYVYVTV